MNLRKLAVTMLDVSGVGMLTSPLYAGRGAILMLHRVVPEKQLTLMPGNVVTVELLSHMLEYLTRNGYEFVPVGTIPERLRSRAARRRFIAITLDDGCLDNLEYGLPVFNRYGAYFTIYAVTGFLDRTVLPWWMLLEHLILSNDEVALNDPTAGPVKAQCTTPEEKRSAYKKFTPWGYRYHDRFDGILSAAYERAGMSMAGVLDRKMLSWDQARSLAHHRLGTIGAHGVTHRPLHELTDQAAYREIAECRERLSGGLGTEVREIAYPFGSCGARELQFAREIGFEIGVTTGRGTIQTSHRDSLLALPRIAPSMAPHAASLRFLRVSLNGSWNKLANWRDPRGPQD